MHVHLEMRFKIVRVLIACVDFIGCSVAQMEFAQHGTVSPVAGSDTKAPTRPSWAEAWQDVTGSSPPDQNGQGSRSSSQSQWNPRIHLQWSAPFFSGGGYSSEAISYVAELSKWLPVGIGKLLRIFAGWSEVHIRRREFLMCNVAACAVPMLTIIRRHAIRYFAKQNSICSTFPPAERALT